MARTSAQAPAAAGLMPQTVLMPLVLSQFICSYASSSLNVAITPIANDLGTPVSGIQTAITLFTLTMAALMIPGSKLSDILGRRFCLVLGLAVYGLGALIASVSPSLGVLVIGYSLLQGIGTALLIPPVYIIATVFFADLSSRARAFGSISAAAGVGAAAGPLIGGVIATATTWRLSFVLQAVVVAAIILLVRRIKTPARQSARPTFDLAGAVLSAAGLFFLVVGILQAGTYGWVTASADFVVGGVVVIPQGGISPFWLFELIGAVLLFLFFRHIRSLERAGKEPLLSTAMFRRRTSNLGLVTQNIQWLILMGMSFVVSVYLQTVRGYNAVETGLILTPATAGIFLASAAAARMARRRPQAVLIRAGFLITIAGIVLLLLFTDPTSNILASTPGLFAIGVGVGVMLTSSVNVVQSSFGEEDQGEISGLSRSVSNLGSSLGVAIAGTVIVSPLVTGNAGYGLALIVLVAFALVGFVAAMLMPAIAPVPAELQAIAPEPEPQRA